MSTSNGVQIIDLSHNISPQNIREGAWALLTSYKYFPKGSIFLAVVDPGVGTGRKALAIKAGDYYFVGPDNGLLYPAAVDAGILEVIELNIPEGAGSTFHGRDVFAPTAAKLASGSLLGELGKPAAPEVKLTFNLAGREGEVVTIDRFGNVITNIPPLPHRRNYKVSLLENSYCKELPFYSTYADAPDNMLFLITGSSGTLEISIKNRAAKLYLEVGVGGRIIIE